MKPRLFVARRVSPRAIALLAEHCAVDVWEGEDPAPRPVLLERVRGIDGLFSTVTERVDAELLDAAGPGLRVVSQMAVGYDNIDVAAAAARGVAVGNTPGVMVDATADIAFALLLAAARRIAEADRFVRAGQWGAWHPALLLGHDLAGATLGIVGFGRIGQAMARRARGFDMRILACGPRVTDEDAAAHGAERADLDTVLRTSDYLSLHLPLNQHTRHTLDAAAFAKMKPTAILINTARGPVVDQAALVHALTHGQIAAAGLDVTDPEPIRPDDPLLQLDNVTLLPHIGSATTGTRERMAVLAAENLLAGVRGQPLRFAVTG
jgi:lactate dehydrogenase-like 2-hydroxyacid dehydrogenase